jgi:glycosyltransferase involved in cell wall biosynthesis
VIRRVALISEHASPAAVLGTIDCGGQNVYVAQLALHLARRGIAVDVFTRRERGDQPEVQRWAPGVRIVHVPAGPPITVRKEDLLPFMGEFARLTIDFAIEESITYDVAHANFWMSGLVALAMKRALGVSTVVTFHALGRVRRQHQGDADRSPPSRTALEEQIVEQSDGIVAECPEDAMHLRLLYGADASRMRVIPCGVDRTRFHPVPKPSARRAIGLTTDTPCLLQLGRMVPRKGVDDAIRATALVRHTHGVPARLLVVGGETDDPETESTPELERLRGVARDHDVADAVTFVGRRGGDALRFYYSAADVFVTLPWYEPFGMTPLEAMACGTPVVGSRVGGLKFTVRDGETGFLVPPRDPAAAAERLATLCTGHEQRAAFAAAALRDVQARFAWDDVAAAMVAFYETARDRAPRAAFDHAQRAVAEIGGDLSA